jgi:hypothetical protein
MAPNEDLEYYYMSLGFATAGDVAFMRKDDLCRYL